MTGQELFSQESEILGAQFGINPIKNLESSNESVVYNIMIRNIDRGEDAEFQSSRKQLEISKSPVSRRSLHRLSPTERFILYETSKRNQNKKAVINLTRRWAMLQMVRDDSSQSSTVDKTNKLLGKQSKILKWGEMKFPVKLWTQRDW